MWRLSVPPTKRNGILERRQADRRADLPSGPTNADDKTLNASGVRNMDFAILDNDITTGWASGFFVKTLGLGAKQKVDIQAVKLP